MTIKFINEFDDFYNTIIYILTADKLQSFYLLGLRDNQPSSRISPPNITGANGWFTFHMFTDPIPNDDNRNYPYNFFEMHPGSGNKRA